jgi:glycosyltransferase involved in cell wall biosynthesis
MKVSVCIPTFNSEAYLASCIESVLGQNGVEFEVIFFDNASEDTTWKIVKTFSDPRLRAFRADKNCGMAANFNRAVGEARGEYVKLLCSDDLLEPSALSLQARFLDKHRETAMTNSATTLIDSNSVVRGAVKWFSEVTVVRAPNLRAISLIYGNTVGEPSAVMFRRDAWVAAGPFRDGLVTLVDLDMWLRLSREGGVGYLPVPLCRIRRHGRSMTNQFRGAGEVQEAVLKMTEVLLRDLEAPPMVRRISLGKVAGSHVRHALFGIRSGFVKWPLSSLAKAFRIDPGFIGLFLYLALFRSGLLGLRVEQDGKPSLCTTSTLRCLSEAQ